jgi:2-polyprenyl-3-methyl-5-hydroxy-6-metoxy-1,4-benzoquinol methylase
VSNDATVTTKGLTMQSLRQHCPLCESGRLSDIYCNVNGYTITRCLSCRLVFVREEITTPELIEYYRQSDGEDFVYADPENVKNLNYYFHRLRHLLEQLTPQGRILDVGCSAGYFLNVMDGWERYGIEIPSMWAEMARQTYGDRIHVGTLEDSHYPAEFFDVITLQDTFDHLVDPLESLGICRRILKLGGRIVIKVHNIECLYARLSGRRFYAIIPPSHLFYYSKATLKLALEKSGYALEVSTFIGHTLFLKTIPYRLSRSNQKSLFYKAYQLLDKSPLGNITVPKNLHDIITVVGVKNQPGGTAHVDAPVRR